MDKYDIGGFATWEKNDEGKSVIRYSDDGVKRLNNRNLEIVNVIIEHSVNYDNFITAAEICDELKAKGLPDYDRDSVKKALQRIRKDSSWRDVIVSSANGYLISCSAIDDEADAAATEPEATFNRVNVSGSEMLSELDSIPYEFEPVPLPKGEAPIIDKSPAIIEISKNDTYIKSFLSDNKRVRTYFYNSDSRDVLDIAEPLTLIGGGNDSYDDVCFKDLYEGDQRHRYIVAAPVGSGKSLLARKLALEAANDYSNTQIVPILYDLSGYTESDKSLFDIFKDEYISYFPGEQKESGSEFSFYCQAGNVLLLLDGLDQIPSKIKGSFFRKLKVFLRSYSNNTIIIFTRPTDSFSELDTFTVLRIKQVIGIETEDLVERLLGSSDSNVKGLEEYILQNQKLSMFKTNLFGNPLFVSVICSKNKHVYHFEKPLIHEDIEDFIKYVTGQDPSGRSRKTSGYLMTAQQLDHELSYFCYYLLMNNIESFDANDVYESWNHFHLDHVMTAHDLLDYLCISYGLIEYRDGKYEFIDSLIVSYYYAKTLLKHGIVRQSFINTMENCFAYSADYTLDLLYEMDSDAVSQEIYCPLIDEVAITSTYTEYEEFLIKFYPELEYYVGKGDFETDNRRNDYIYRHLIKDWVVDEDINHLVLPPVDSLEKTPIYKVDNSLAEKFGRKDGLIEELYFKLLVRDNDGYKPIGYVYRFKMEDALQIKDETSLKFRAVIMSDDFPLRKEFEEVISVRDELEDDE